MQELTPLKQAIKKCGRAKVAEACGVTQQAVWKWEQAGRLPRTEWTGESDYASTIAKMSGFSRTSLLRFETRA